MFVIAVLPMTDLRVFAPPPTTRLARPTWPFPRAGHDFIRSIGQVAPRRRGGVAPWGEDAFCTATRAIKYDPPLNAHRVYVGPSEMRFAGQYRRLYSDGVLTRLEVGLKPRGYLLHDDADIDLLALVAGVASIPVLVPSPPRRFPLIRATDAVAELLVHRTTGHGTQSPRWSVAGGSPVVIVEYGRYEIMGSARRFRPVPVEAVPEAELGHLRVVSEGTPITVWVLKSPLFSASTRRAAEDAKRLRELRVHLIRLHVMREGLKAALRAVGEGHLNLSDRTAEADNLQLFLHRQASLLEKPRSYGFNQAGILHAAYSSDALVHDDQRRTICHEVARVRRNYARTITAAMERPTGPEGVAYAIQAVEHQVVIVNPQEVQIMRFEDSKKVEVGNVAGDITGVIGFDNLISNSFNRLESADTPTDVRDRLKALGEAVRALESELRPEQKEAAARDYAGLVAEATAPSPRTGMIRAFVDGLSTTARTAASAGLEVVRLSEAVGRLF